MFGQQVRYQIRNDPADGVPVLERISTADVDTAPFAPAPQVIARGIEELQVRYSQFTPAGTWRDDAPLVAAPTDGALDLPATQAAFGTMINRLQITLTSRAEGRNLQGGLGRRRRGSAGRSSRPCRRARRCWEWRAGGRPIPLAGPPGRLVLGVARWRRWLPASSKRS